MKKVKISEKKIPCLIYSRICGYFQNLDQWNKGKREEFRHRKNFSIKKIRNKLSI